MLKLPKTNIIKGTWESILSSIREDRKTREDCKRGWIYRGILDNWSFQTTLERVCRVDESRPHKVEPCVIREFQRKFHHIAPEINVPRDADTMWWLSVMQHHGAPTRLLDWTYSPYIAAYFALECKFNELSNAPKQLKMKREGQSRAAIWAIRGDWLLNKGKEFIKDEDEFKRIKESEPKSLDRFFEQVKQKPFVHQANTLYLSKRLSIQQGVFLFATDIIRPFEDNLKSMEGWNSDNPSNIKKYVISNDCVLTALDELHAMNVNRTSLFPGLDGFANSLMTRASRIPLGGSSPS